ncbi:hypothetical protein RND81_03G171900 [Saponaria officinalis]|uniref:Integrase catalytic domain-containing protein n=1 Tax=Saponaria officinalis TaxID=3572 RepID=A0AAW1MA25_SAPOF
MALVFGIYITPSSPLYLHPSDCPSLMLTQILFNGENYELWADAVRNGLDAKNKLGITFSGSVVEIWKELKERFTAGNAPRIHQLKSELSECKQEKNQSIVEYYTRLKAIWDELGNYSRVPQCTCGAAAELAKEREEEKVHQFLLGLDTSLYGNLRTNLLMKDDITSLSRAYALVLREERHKAITKSRDEVNDAAMAVRMSNEEGRGRGFVSNNGGKDTDPVVNAALVNETETQKLSFTPEEVTRLRSLLGKKSSDGNKKPAGRNNNMIISNWLLDSGDSHHMTGQRGLLTNIRRKAPSNVTLPDGTHIVAQEHGEIVLNDNFILKDDQSTRMKIGRGEQRYGVYYLKNDKVRVARTSAKQDTRLWHKRLGHPSSNTLSLLIIYDICDVCCRAKQTRSVFKLNHKRSSDLFALIHCDIWGPYHIKSLSGAQYFLTIVDYKSRGVWVYLMRGKGEVSKIMMNFFKVVQSDNGTEFLSGTMREYYSENGMIFQTSNTDTPQQNGRVERKHKHILEKARALCFQANLPIEFWGECVLTAAYLINRTPTRILDGLTPYEVLHGERPILDNVKRCIFVGYPHSKKGWKSRDVIFYEHIFPFSDIASTNSNEKVQNNVPDTSATIETFDLHSDNDEGNNNGVNRDSNTSEGEQINESEQVMQERAASDNKPVGRGAREKFEPYWKRDYVCKSTRIIDPTSNAQPVQLTSTRKGTHYPIANYVTTNYFSINHRNYLANVDAVREPRDYLEAAQKEEWR